MGQNLEASQSASSKSWFAGSALGWGIAWSLTWLAGRFDDFGLLPWVLSGATGGLIAGYGQSVSLQGLLGRSALIWRIVSVVSWSISWVVLISGVSIGILFVPFVACLWGCGPGVTDLHVVAFAALASAISGAIGGTIVGVSQWIVLQRAASYGTPAIERRNITRALGKLVLSWGIASLVTLLTASIGGLSRFFKLTPTPVDFMILLVPGGVVGGIAFAWLSGISVLPLAAAGSPLTQSEFLHE